MALDSYSREALPSRVLILNQVMDALKDPNLQMIGVCGMGGIGKTTLAKEVYWKAVEEELFDFVAMVTVSQTPNLSRIQGEIAVFLGLEFDAEEVPTGRASRLYERLEYSKVLIILDDIWAGFDLKSVGIPFGKRSKIFLTSTTKDVLCFEMGTQKDLSLEVLNEDEARSLFEMTTGEVKHPEMRAIAYEVVERCAGLPLLVTIVATYLKNRELSAWTDTLKKLSDFGNEELPEKLHKVLKSIYESLPSNEVKSFFLLCALFEGPNIPVNHLQTYAMGLGLFGNTIRLQDAREKLIQMIEMLKTESLLLDGDMSGYVKMHDVVLDVARSIATKEQHTFYGISGHELREWPSRDCTRIALPYCEINELPQGLEYPKAELFSFSSKALNLEIPDIFFEGFRELNVLNLTGMCFMSLPTSLHFLTNLYSLHLDGCQLDDVAIIGELKQLEFLSFANSYIVELPKQIEQLSQLKLLDLTNCTQLKVFPANVLSKLSVLEELYMGNSFVRWDAGENISVMELEKLFHLTTLEIQVIDVEEMPNYLFFRGLQSYRIFIGDGWAWDGTYEASKTLKLRLKTNNHMEDELKQLLRGTQVLYLDEIKDTENLLHDIDGEGYRQLKHLHIRNDDAIRHIINSTTRASCHAFPILETLSLDNLESLQDIFSPQLEDVFSKMVAFPNLQIMRVSIMDNLEDIWHSQLTANSFCKLKSLKISSCRNLLAVFSSNVVRRFQSLEELFIYNCPEIEEIYQLGELNSNEVATFELRHLRIDSMDSLKCIWSSEGGDGLFNFQNLKSVVAYDCAAMEYVFPESIACGLLQLGHLRVSRCGVEHIVGKRKSVEVDDEAPHNFNFPELTFLRLQYLRRLRSFYPKTYFCEWPKLKYLKVCGCHEAMKLDVKVLQVLSLTLTFFMCVFLIIVNKVSILNISQILELLKVNYL